MTDSQIEAECPHGNWPVSNCAACDPRPHMVMKCVTCQPGQTWHALEGEATWVCRKCGAHRDGPAAGDISITSGTTFTLKDDKLPEIPDLKLTITEVREPSRKLNVTIAPIVTRCGMVSTMSGMRKLHECDQQFDGDCIVPPAGWAIKTTGPNNKGYFYAVCERHA